jgi:hypothetical protein
MITGTLDHIPEPDLVAIKSYAAKMANTLLHSFFSKHSVANGPQLVDFVPVKQVNLLMMRNLQRHWTQEAERLRSPYFDYSNPEVQLALKQFMNTLSQHISLNKATLQPVLEQAIADTILLALAPLEFFKHETELLANPKVNILKMKEGLRFIGLNKHIPEAVFTEMEQLRTTELFGGELQRYFKKAYHETANQLFNPKELIDSLSLIYPVQLSDLTVHPPVSASFMVTEPKEPASPATDFFSQFQAEAFKPETTHSSVPDSLKPFTSITHEPEIHASGSPSEAPATKPDPIIQEVKTPINKEAASKLRPEPFNSFTGKEESAIQNAIPVQQDFTNLNDSVGASKNPQKGAINEAVAKSKIESLKTGIPLNDRFLFQRELFHNSKSDWDNAIDQLDNALTSEQVSNSILPFWANLLKWDTSPGSTADQFKTFVLRRYGK